MSASQIVTSGFGGFGSIGAVVMRGFIAGAGAAFKFASDSGNLVSTSETMAPLGAPPFADNGNFVGVENLVLFINNTLAFSDSGSVTSVSEVMEIFAAANPALDISMNDSGNFTPALEVAAAIVSGFLYTPIDPPPINPYTDIQPP